MGSGQRHSELRTRSSAAEVHTLLAGHKNLCDLAHSAGHRRPYDDALLDVAR